MLALAEPETRMAPVPAAGRSRTAVVGASAARFLGVPRAP